MIEFLACTMMFASVYGHPQNTSSGEWFDGKALTLALRDVKVPFGSWYYVTYKRKTITLRYIDRGPFVNKPRRRDADLSTLAAEMLEFPGLDFVKVCPIESYSRH